MVFELELWYRICQETRAVPSQVSSYSLYPSFGGFCHNVTITCVKRVKSASLSCYLLVFIYFPLLRYNLAHMFRKPIIAGLAVNSQKLA